jgi:hypothetical protein
VQFTPSTPGLTSSAPYHRSSFDPSLHLQHPVSVATRALRAGHCDKMKLTGSAIALLAATTAAKLVPRAAKAPTVDLGYAVYEGSVDVNNSINAFKGYEAVCITADRFLTNG